MPTKDVVIEPCFNGVPVYAQYDSRWVNSPYDWIKTKSCDDNSTVSSSGCGPCAVAMVINFWATKRYCEFTSPDIVAKFFADHGGRKCGGGSVLEQVPKEKFQTTFGVVLNTDVTEDQILKALEKGYPCIISAKRYNGYNFKGKKLTGKYKGHFTCLTGK